MLFFYQTNTIKVMFINNLALSSFVMAVNGGRDFEALRSASVHHKSNPYYSSGLMNAF